MSKHNYTRYLVKHNGRKVNITTVIVVASNNNIMEFRLENVIIYVSMDGGNNSE